ncbi:MFS transporter [Streptomyces sp. NBC_00878]|uniref:MFS transporter n=1 Tax=Streptomyces sp. NBC_00878 TaxID=2975854 RepID=UPI002252F9EB|nr:MFS transporter [Streptomyces sp. NBC_00878]MCX4910615.1 MFS transporter [Streptomyces sp. NBC_00878]
MTSGTSRGLGRPFWLLFTGESASALGTAASLIALPVVALRTTGDLRQAGLVSTVLAIGVIAARLPAGVLADRYSRRSLLRAGNLTGAVVLAAFALLLLKDAVTLPVLLATAVLLGATGSTLAPAENVAVRSYVHPELRPKALGLIQIRAAVAMIAGPLAGGALLAVDAHWVFAADAATYAAAVLCMTLLPAVGPHQEPAEEEERSSPVRAATEGIRFIWRQPFLRYAALNATVLNLVFNGLLIVIVSTAGAGGSALDVGAQVAALGGGALVGSLLAAPVAQRLTPGTGIGAGTGVVALCLVGFAVFREPWAALPLIALAAAAGPVITVVVSAAEMRITPPELQGRVHSGVGFLAQAIAPAGPALAGLSVHALGLPATLNIAAAVVLALAVLGGVVTVRHARSGQTSLGAEPDAPEEAEEPAATRHG